MRKIRLRNLGFLAGLLAAWATLSPTATAQGAEAARLHVLLVIDSQGKNAGPLGIMTDGVNLQRAFQEFFRDQGLTRRATLTVLSGARATPQSVLTYYRNLKTGPSDAVVFFYSGHGATDRRRGHMLTLRWGTLLRQDLRRAMTRQRPRLAVILTDCCADLTGLRRSVAEEELARTEMPLLPERAPTRGGGTVARQLFLQHRGLVDINAAQTGKSASGTAQRGGFFTSSLITLLSQPLEAIDVNRDRFVEWREFFPAVQRQTQRVGAAARFPQTPMAFALQVGRTR